MESRDRSEDDVDHFGQSVDKAAANGREVGSSLAASGIERKQQTSFSADVLGLSQAQQDEGLDENMLQLYNQYISVEVSEPMWSNEGV